MSFSENPTMFDFDEGSASDAVPKVVTPQKSNTIKKGALRSPDELGVAASTSVPTESTKQLPKQEKPQQRPVKSLRGHRRSMVVMKSTMSPAATAASIASTASNVNKQKENDIDCPSIVCSFAYRGMEVVFATTRDSQNKWSIFGICSRTRVAFQTLDVSGGWNGRSIISMTGDPLTGMVALAMSDGSIQTYNPVETNPIPSSCPDLSSTKVATAFGRYRWKNGRTINCADVFYSEQNGKAKGDIFHQYPPRKSGASVNISLSFDHKVLVAHCDQLAVFDATPERRGTNSTLTTVDKKPSETYEAELLWTTKVQANIVEAALSGDGHAITYVLEGEGKGTPDPMGARTFVRDLDDGATRLSTFESKSTNIPKIPKPSLNKHTSSGSSGVGILYKSGPFLVHSAHVTRLSFRGLGHETSNICSNDYEGDDLLLTYCKEDNSVRIFSQNSWKQLMHWTTPPESRADWVRGITAFNLGDLESHSRKKGKGGGKSEHRRRPSDSALSDDGSGSSGAINKALGSRPFTPVTPNTSTPSSAAGAWISELTFRNGFPALRLSRLSYLKRGDKEAQPAHFESVAAILPVGSLVAENVLRLNGMGLSVQGIWPAWDPWAAGHTVGEENSLSGSAMALLGLPTGPAASGGFFGDNHSGTHSPPSELRLVASHPVSGNIVLMEFPLWGDQDFGAMELGSPLRYVLSLSEGRLSDVGELYVDDERTIVTTGSGAACLDYESNRLCARIANGGKSVSLTWRKQGGLSILPIFHRSHGTGTSSMLSTAYTAKDFSGDGRSFDIRDSSGPDAFQDVGVVPLPLSLPPLRLPPILSNDDNESILAIKWWPDENFGGPPRVLAVTSSGTLILFEMPPPWCALEPVMPNYDPFEATGGGSNSSIVNGDLKVSGEENGAQNSDEEDAEEYEAMVTPHPDFGIGLRLESQADGMPAVAGSYKKHPLTGGRLPAEKTGKIRLGDELISVNGVVLEGLTFDDIIATVRKIGQKASPGEALRMKFRPKRSFRKKTDSLSGATSTGGGVTPGASSSTNGDNCDSDASVLIGADCELQQEFSRIIAISRKVISGQFLAKHDSQSLFELLPWRTANSRQPRGLALLVFADGGKLRAKRLEIAADHDPEKAQCFDLGSYEINNTKQRSATIQSISMVKHSNDGWCVATYDDNRDVRLVFLDVQRQGQNVKQLNSNSVSSQPLGVSFRCHSIFQCNDFPTRHQHLVRPHSVELVGTMAKGLKECNCVEVWHACPFPSEHAEDDRLSQEYVKTVVTIDPDTEGETQAEIIDFCFFQPGSLDAFPWLVLFTHTSSIVYRRRGDSLNWHAIAELAYSALDTSTDLSLIDSGATPLPNERSRWQSHLSPADALPHLCKALQNTIVDSDEKDYLRSDWHPESILAYICTQMDGANAAMRSNVYGIYIWLSRWLSSDESIRPLLNLHFPLGTIPLETLQSHNMPNDDNEDGAGDNAANLVAMLSLTASSKTKKTPTEEDMLLAKLQTVLCPGRTLKTKERKRERDNDVSRSKEFLLAMAHASELTETEEDEEDKLPPPLQNLSRDEIRLLWSIGQLFVNPPKFKFLDPPSQMTMFCTSLLRSISSAKNDNEEEETASTEASVSPRTNNQPSTWGSTPYLVKKKSSFETTSDSNTFYSIASAGCVAALCSDCQGQLLQSCRPPNEKLDWATARQIKLPFWIRSDSELRVVTEEIGMRAYKDNRDVMECAIFFIALRDTKKLRTLSHTDNSVSGKKFCKFLVDYDFSTPRGRKAAEKNAYSLLRKRRYTVAASFFLLTEPPMLKTALEVIVNNMGDLDLAFLVARLMDRAPETKQVGAMGFVASSTSFGTVIGGGGGFVGSGILNNEPKEDDVKFKDWKPKLGKNAKTLITDRLLDLTGSDFCAKAVQLMWLGKIVEATWTLSGLSTGTDKDCSDTFVPRSFDLIGTSGIGKLPSAFSRGKTTQSANGRVISKANELIDFISCPFLLKSMAANTRAQWTSTLLVSRALSRRGIDVPSLRTLVGTTNSSDLKDKKDDTKEALVSAATPTRVNSSSESQQGGDTINSSIFDGFDVLPQHKQNVQEQKSPGSIFDSFAAAPQTKNKSAPAATTETMSSSIFDSFDPVPPKPKAAASKVHQETMSSSIFDSFDPVPPKPKVASIKAQQETMSSSIFDSFDPAPPKPEVSKSSDQQKMMTSSIFDSFDPAPVKTKVKSSPANVGQDSMKSSIFDEYETQPPKSINPAPSVPTGEMASSIFDSFDGPPATKSKAVSTKPADSNGGAIQTQDPHGESVTHDISPVVPSKTPTLWLEWRRSCLLLSLARRFLREVATTASRFHGDPLYPPMKLFRHHTYHLVPYSATEILHSHCSGGALLSDLKKCLGALCDMGEVGEAAVIDQALQLLSGNSQPDRIVFSVMLYAIKGRTDLAEDVIRNAAHAQIQLCETLAFSNNDLVHQRKSVGNVSSLYLRRKAAQVSWQLELCLWLHRGGAFAMSDIATKETIVAVRIGLLVSCWGRSHECLEKMIRCEPDCPVDEEAGRQLWSSLKMISSPGEQPNKAGNVSSGGWEFLVDCRRDEATEMLRKRPTGSFVLRPHANDTGVFSLSFKTNLKPSCDAEEDKASNDTTSDPTPTVAEGQLPPKPINNRPVRKDEVVQHAIIRLSDAGFRCGSFGPFTTLMKLLEAVSASLPFNLLIDKPPIEGIIKDQGTQPSPNSFLFRKLALNSQSANYRRNRDQFNLDPDTMSREHDMHEGEDTGTLDNPLLKNDEKEKAEFLRRKRFGMFTQLLALSEVRKQMSAIVSVVTDEDYSTEDSSWGQQEETKQHLVPFASDIQETGSFGSLSDDAEEILGVEELYAVASRILRPFLNWCRLVEIDVVFALAPPLRFVAQASAAQPVAMAASEKAVEVAVNDVGSCIDGGDAVIRRWIQPDSQVEFKTLKVGEGGESAMIILFRKSEAVQWFISTGTEDSKEDAEKRLVMMEQRRVIEQVDLSEISTSSKEAANEVRYRFIDPWEVEALKSRECETRGASLGRARYYEFSVGRVAGACEQVERSLGGLHLMNVWSAARGGICLTKAIASVHPPWERDAGGDLLMSQGLPSEPSAFDNSIRQHLYRNAIFRRLGLPQRFLSLIQVELLDLKNLTSPGSSTSLSVYSLLRLKRPGSGAPLSHKARTLDSASTQPKKINRSTGPNAPAGWGSLVRFRFPLPEDVTCDGISYDGEREALFKGAPSVLQISVYEKKFMNDISLGGADINLDALSGGSQMEEWVPLRASKHGIHWFARVRITLRFELMCIESEADNDTEESERPPSVGLKKIRQLSLTGGAHEDANFKKSSSTPDLLSYFESMVY